ncbi:MAG: TonB-dependent receptor [Vicinamibacterales bacterium]
MFTRLLMASAIACLVAGAPGTLLAQEAGHAVGGVVRAASGTPVAGAAVGAGTGASARTDSDGRFTLRLPPGAHVLRVSHPAYAAAVANIDVSGPVDDLDIRLALIPRFAEEVVVAAVRADAEAPITKRDLDRREIDRLNTGQEMPFLLKDVPSLTQYSDSGAQTGYSYIYLRGIPQTRMNVTLDGVPLNEPEDSAFYFANFGDFANAIESLQVQRGVGTSTVGAASFVGSINFASIDLKEEASADVRVGAGSFGTNRVSAAAHSGRLGGGVKLYGQAAYQDTEGFRRNSGSTQRSVYLGATRDTDASFFKVFGFAGQEASQLAFLAADEDALGRDLRANPMSADERDEFGQRFVTAQYHRAVGPSTELSVQGYYNGAGGWYRIQDGAGGLYQYNLDWHSLGATATYRAVRGAFDVTWGGHVNDFESRHARDLVEGPMEYANRGFKNEVNSFVKLGYAGGRWRHYGDVQVRWVRFRFEGDLDLGSVGWTFFNPKIGTRYDLGRGVSAYASVGLAGREPARSDMLQGQDNPTVVYDLSAVKPEQVVNVEAGIEWSRPGLTLRANGYSMAFRNEIAQTGELSEVGLPLRRNVDRSARRGVEVDVTWRPVRPLQVRHSATYSYNRIRSWTQSYDIYDTSGAWSGATSVTHENVVPLLTPAVLVGLSAEYSPVEWFAAGAAGRYVGSAHLDNTNNDEFRAPGFFGLDADASLSLARLLPATSGAAPRLRVQVTNLLDNRRMFPSGYSYQYLLLDGAGGTQPGGTRYYYPQATRSVMVMLDMRF